jgi:hypothetical protein
LEKLKEVLDKAQEKLGKCLWSEAEIQLKALHTLATEMPIMQEVVQVSAVFLFILG